MPHTNNQTIHKRQVRRHARKKRTRRSHDDVLFKQMLRMLHILPAAPTRARPQGTGATTDAARTRIFTSICHTHTIHKRKVRHESKKRTSRSQGGYYANKRSRALHVHPAAPWRARPQGTGVTTNDARKRIYVHMPYTCHIQAIHKRRVRHHAKKQEDLEPPCHISGKQTLARTTHVRTAAPPRARPQRTRAATNATRKKEYATHKQYKNAR